MVQQAILIARPSRGEVINVVKSSLRSFSESWERGDFFLKVLIPRIFHLFLYSFDTRSYDYKTLILYKTLFATEVECGADICLFVILT